MVDYELLQNQLNVEAVKILYLIKNDYYKYMSEQKKALIDNLINKKQIVVVNKGLSKSGSNLLAHGGRSLKDDKIHYYPDARGFESNEEAFEKCVRILPHELFHYFLQPDDLHFEDKKEQEMAMFYTEGLVERETRKFIKKHPEIVYKNARYGHNIKFVNILENILKASDYKTLFSENAYLLDIGKYIKIYEKIVEIKKNELVIIEELIKEFPKNLQRKFYERLEEEYMQEGNVESIIAKLRILLRESNYGIQASQEVGGEIED